MMKKGRTSQPVVLPTQTRSSRGLAPRDGYFWLSSHPLHILLFLLPIIVVFELGTTGIIGDGVGTTLEAQDMLVRFFDLFGVLGLHLPAFALIAVFVTQQFLSKEPWRIVPIVPLAMIVESAFLTGPLIVLAVIIQPEAMASMMQVAGESAAAGTAMIQSSTLQGIFLAFGAGLYEEMLFRLVLILLIHFIITDVLGFSDRSGKIWALILSAIAFALHHDGVLVPGTGPGSGLNLRRAAFFVLAGIYFGILFLARGYGIAVGTHLMYDLLVLVIMPEIQDQS